MILLPISITMHLSNDVFFVLFRAAELATQGKLPPFLRSDSQRRFTDGETKGTHDREERDRVDLFIDRGNRSSIVDGARW